MAYDPGALEATLAAVVGEDSPLVVELRNAFFDSADDHVQRLKAAVDHGDWLQSAGRLRSLAASFGLQRIIDSAEAAMMAPCGEARAIERIERALKALRPA